MTLIDPLAAFRAGATVGGAPVPLTATAYDVTLAGGLAVVQCIRRFRNAEDRPIEATITFPVPIAATVFRLAARIGGRLLEGRVQRKAEARGTYEGALDRGRAAVLHEEVLRGVHMLSVGQVPPGAEVEVTVAWAMVMPVAGGVARLRIPLTVGEIYGRSPLPDSDDLVTGGPGGMARLVVRCKGGTAIMGRRTLDGPVEVPLDRPVDIAVTGWSTLPLPGRAADGSWLQLMVSPLPEASARLDLAVVVDRSGSMAAPCGMEAVGVSVHDTVRRALVGLHDGLRRDDRLELWEFNTQPRRVGRLEVAEGDMWEELSNLVEGLSPPAGGTEIGTTLERVLASTEARDVLLVTDGKSHALDAAALAHMAHGRRVNVLLVGEDSLEAQVGHLAGLTGGSLAVAGLNDAGEMLRSMLVALPAVTVPQGSGVLAVRGLAAISVAPAAPVADADPLLVRAVAAVATALRLAELEPEQAETLAVAEGIVTGQTSLVLVDEAGEVHEGVAATRKVALPTPAVAAHAPSAASYDPGFAYGWVMGDVHDLEEPAIPAFLRRQPPALGEHDPAAMATEHVLGNFAQEVVDWNANPAALASGSLDGAPDTLVRYVAALVADAHLQEMAEQLGMAPVVLAIALLARAHAGRDRTAARIARAMLGPEQEGRIP
jgi:hypothetical protein